MRTHFVYYLTLGGVVAYIGRSVNPQGRWRYAQRHHHANLILSKKIPFSTLSEAQRFERKELVRLDPTFNKTIASSACRVGKKNSIQHNKAISEALKGRVLSKEHKDKLWATRDRSPELFGHPHTEETKKVLSSKHAAQFADPIKRAKHLEACLASIERRRNA